MHHSADVPLEQGPGFRPRTMLAVLFLTVVPSHVSQFSTDGARRRNCQLYNDHQSIAQRFGSSLSTHGRRGSPKVVRCSFLLKGQGFTVTVGLDSKTARSARLTYARCYILPACLTPRLLPSSLFSSSPLLLLSAPLPISPVCPSCLTLFPRSIIKRDTLLKFSRVNPSHSTSRSTLVCQSFAWFTGALFAVACLHMTQH